MMLLEAFLQTRTDRFIAAGRAVIALFALAAIWIDPSQPAGAADVTYALLVGYLAFAGGILLASRRETLWSAEIGLGSHIVDLAVFSTIMFLTEGATSPFFLLFTFSLLSATFRWQWKGALWTAVTVLFLLVAIAVVYRAVAPGQPFEVDRFAIRCAHIVVIGAMLVYFGFRQQRSAEEAARLAAWQPDPAVGADSRSLLAACLDHVANVFAAPRVVLVLQMQADPWASVATWEDGTFHLDRLAAGDIDKMVPEALAEASFMRHASGDMLVADPRGRVSLGRGEQTGSVMAGFGLERVLSVPVRSDYAKGRLFIADKQDFAREELVLASLVALQIGVLLDRVQVIESAQQSAATEERLRLARDLHDGILQTLAGTALQLETIRRLAEQDPASLPARINEMQSWLLDEQREMRGFISKLRPPGPWVRSGLASEHADLPALVRALEQQWGATISLPAEGGGCDRLGRNGVPRPPDPARGRRQRGASRRRVRHRAAGGTGQQRVGPANCRQRKGVACARAIRRAPVCSGPHRSTQPARTHRQPRRVDGHRLDTGRRDIVDYSSVKEYECCRQRPF
jgi:signal transduction histidine kinase